MSERNVGSIRKVVRLGLVLGLGMLAAGCSKETTAGAQPKPKSVLSFHDGDSVREFMATAFADSEVYACTGEGYLRTDGHFRTGPNADNDNRLGGDGKPLNAISAYNDNSGNVLITSPEKVRLDNGDATSPGWYIVRLASGQLAFVNHNALEHDTFRCDQPATPQTPAGAIEFQAIP